MKATLLSFGALAALLIGGCSEKAKEDMSAAGDSASNAAAHTGAAVADDTKAAGAEVKAAGTEVKQAGDNAVQATKDAGAAVAKGAETAGATVVAGAKEAGTAVAKGAEKAGATVVAGTKEAGAAVANAGKQVADASMTPKVKTALDNAAGLDTSKIDVDTVGKTIMLKGSVPDAKQKKQAEMATKGIAGTEYKVVDQLTVGG